MANDGVGGLRQQLEAALEERAELRAYKRKHALGKVLGEFGLSAEKGPGKLVLGQYEGTDPDELREFLEAHGFEPPSDEEDDRPVDERAEAYVRVLAAREGL